MLKYVSGDFFDYQASIRINTVNCVGVMGAGVALAFKNRYPEMYKGYVSECEAGNLAPGRPWVWKGADMFSDEIEIINLPTKKHWRNPSQYSYIEDGLKWLSRYLLDKAGSVVTLPALGCGHGGLEWAKVKELIEQYLSNVPAEILVFEPSASKKISKPKFDKNLDALLAINGVKIVTQDSLFYPEPLKRYTRHAIFNYSNLQESLVFDFALICSSKPEALERELIEKFIDGCFRNNKRVLLGGSAYEKKLALSYAGRGLKVSCFLPTGILKAADKLKEIAGGDKLGLLSIGDPLKDFDKSQYLPSVLCRIYTSTAVMFFAPRLSWLTRFNEKMLKEGVESYFVDYECLGTEDVKAIKDLGAKPLSLSYFSDDYYLMQLTAGHA